MRWLAAVVAAVLVLSVAACSPGKASRCEEAFVAATASVDGVSSAEWDCNFNFGGGWIRSHVVIEADTEAEAVAVMEAVLRSMAASPDLENGWSTPQEYVNQDGTIKVGTNALAFNGVPNVGQVRARYGITPR
jgi:hypothetical protein